jgi:hypothetical protein
MCLDSPAPVFNCGPCPHCNSFKTERNGYCATYNADQRKAERQALKDASKVKTPIAKRTPKRAAQEREYLKLNREYLEQWPKCEVPGCLYRSQEVHHLQGRENERLNDQDYWMAVCSDHHKYIHDHPEWSRSQGYLLTRSVTTH